MRERWSAQASFASNLASSTGVTVSTRNAVNFGALHLLPWNHWFYSGLGGLLQSSEQGITLQSTFGGGIGRYLINSNKASRAISVREADRQLSGTRAAGEVEWESATTGPHHQSRKLDVAFLVGATISIC